MEDYGPFGVSALSGFVLQNPEKYAQMLIDESNALKAKIGHLTVENFVEPYVCAILPSLFAAAKTAGDLMPPSHNPHSNIRRSSMSEAMRAMPRYRCHKEVWALKIKTIRFVENGGAEITPEDEGYAPFLVDDAYISKHGPQEGGYYVVYNDGYKSWSPPAAFESGYTRI